MTYTEINDHLYNNKPITLNHNCKTENGITDDEIYTIDEIIGDYEQLRIVNQYEQFIIINPNQIVEL